MTVSVQRITAAALSVLLLVLAIPASADSVRNGQWYLGALGITQAHAISQGAGVRVAVIDSGVDGSIPDLADAVVASKGFSTVGTPDGGPIRGDAHGTWNAALLGGRGHGTARTAGVLGVAPAAGVVTAAFDVIGRNEPQQLAAAVRWSVQQGASVINMSFGGSSSSVEEAAYRYAQSEDVVLVAAAGNEGVSRLDTPCRLPGVVCVGGIDANLRHDSRANTGRGLSVVGPFATRDPGSAQPQPHDELPVPEPASAPTRYTGVHGTSSAAPIVAGIIALIRAKYPTMDAANVVNRLIRTARPVGASPNTTYGYGIPDAYRALTANVPTVRTNPLGSLVTPPSSPATSSAPSSAPSSATTATTPTPPVTTTPRAMESSGGSRTGVIAGVAVAVVVVTAGALVAIRRRRPKM